MMIAAEMRRNRPIKARTRPIFESESRPEFEVGTEVGREVAVMSGVCEEVWTNVVGKMTAVEVDNPSKLTDTGEVVGEMKVVVVVYKVMNVVDSDLVEDILVKGEQVTVDEVASELLVGVVRTA